MDSNKIENKDQELKRLGFVRVIAINALVCVSNIYENAKQYSGSLKSTVATVESAVTTVVWPVYEKFKGVPGDLLVFLDEKQLQRSLRSEARSMHFDRRGSQGHIRSEDLVTKPKGSTLSYLEHRVRGELNNEPMLTCAPHRKGQINHSLVAKTARTLPSDSWKQNWQIQGASNPSYYDEAESQSDSNTMASGGRSVPPSRTTSDVDLRHTLNPKRSRGYGDFPSKAGRQSSHRCKNNRLGHLGDLGEKAHSKDGRKVWRTMKDGALKSFLDYLVQAGNLKEYMDQEKTKAEEAEIRPNSMFDCNKDKADNALKEDLSRGTIHMIGNLNHLDLENRILGEIRIVSQ
ncbi:hypothetical protein Acr_00g0030920 [Actinidia rufa]|uniref:Uncharacterized protein n=1 Tax=Actinidia rufa TaxID=165716 RepID=A0A7J0DG78_9ERIC|nr:hypothetical protein Acr_00g0030920 [Actinidia rufa]